MLTQPQPWSCKPLPSNKGRNEKGRLGQSSSSISHDYMLLHEYKSFNTSSHPCSMLCWQPFIPPAILTEHLLWASLSGQNGVTEKKMVLPALTPIDSSYSLDSWWSWLRNIPAALVSWDDRDWVFQQDKPWLDGKCFLLSSSGILLNHPVCSPPSFCSLLTPEGRHFLTVKDQEFSISCNA